MSVAAEADNVIAVGTSWDRERHCPVGEEIKNDSFAPADFDRFRTRLKEETAAAREMFEKRSFSESGYSLGFEIEAWLLDHAFFPNPVNEVFLATIRHPLVVPELSRFNIELNCTPSPVESNVFSRMSKELTDLWAHCERVAHGLDTNIVMIGTLPVIRDEDLSLENLSPLKRYHALNHEVLRRRDGQVARVAINGRDTLVSEHHDVMLEAATTSFQIHLRPGFNARFGVQATAYGTFDGARTNYDGAGRNTSDNDSVFLYAWLAL